MLGLRILAVAGGLLWGSGLFADTLELANGTLR